MNQIPSHTLSVVCSRTVAEKQVSDRSKEYDFLGELLFEEAVRLGYKHEEVFQSAPHSCVVLFFNKKTTIPGEVFAMLPEILTLDRALCIFDLETTGLDPVSDRIIEIGIMRINTQGEIERTYQTLVKPPERITEEVVALTGITNAALDAAPIWGDVAAEVAAIMEDADLAGHNVEGFDYGFLRAEFKRVGIPLPWGEKVHILDTLAISRKQFPHKLETMFSLYRSLSSNGAFKGAHFNAHRALDDVLATAYILVNQLLHEEIGGDVSSLRDHFMGDKIDLFGKLIIKDDRVVINFGKHKGEFLHDVMRDNMSYIDWLMRESTGSFFGDILEGYYNQFMRRA